MAEYLSPAPLDQAPVPIAIASPTSTQYQASDVLTDFEAKLRRLNAEGVSDIHFVGGDVASPVQHGRPLKSTIDVTDDDILAWADLFGQDHGGKARLQEHESGSLGCVAVVGPPGAQLRLRMAFRRQASGLALTVRFVPEVPPRLGDALFQRNPVPTSLIEIALNTPAGLILICGPAGSGKSTMNAALLREVNQTQSKHIYTIEDPIEFVHKPRMSIITQREIGVHTDTFVHALRDSLRSLPNIILVGELVDLETVRVAIEAANKGHLVFATSHASSAEEAVSSLISQFPGSEQAQVATTLSQGLKAVMVQRLIPTVDGKRVPARELLLNTTAVSSKIRENKATQLSQALKPTDGMWSLEDDLQMLWAQDQIDEATARRYCNDRSVLSQKLNYAKEHKAEVAQPRSVVVRDL